jgi:maltose alpha-D-glucosyltransferase/alpha-amylase
MANVPEPPEFATRQVGADQSNSSVLVSETLMLKLYRQVEPGRHPEIEFGRYLTEFAKYANTPPMLGAIELSPVKGPSTALGIAHAFVRNQGDGWEFTVKYLDRFLDESAVLPVEQIPAPDVAHTVYLTQVRQLGRRVAELHMALCRDDAEPAFRPEAADAGDVATWVRTVRNDAKSALAALRTALPKLSTDAVQLAAILVDNRQDILKRIDALAAIGDGLLMTRIHGDLHLGQVLVAQNDFYVIDFEGEPRRPLAERHRKDCPLRDVAGILRSFDYAAWSALENLKGTRAGRRIALREHAVAWRDRAVDAFLSSYRQAIGTTPSYPQKPAIADALLQLFLLGKVFYEIHYELANRPLWVETPLRGAVGILYPDKLI